MSDDEAERFRRDTADHEMTVLRDDGLYRHLRFQSPKRSFYRFDLVTWPGYLAINGGMDGFMFARLPDMFGFFRGPTNGKSEINPQYWAEKLTASSDVKAYSEEKFRQCVVDDFVATVRAGDAPRGLGRAIRADILNREEIVWEDGARKVLEEFEFYKNPDDRYDPKVTPDFTFADLWEWDFTEYTAQYLWCCHAIVWGIAQYDASLVAA